MKEQQDPSTSSEFHPDLQQDVLEFARARPATLFHLGNLYELVACNLPHGLNAVESSNDRCVNGINFFTIQMPQVNPDTLACLATHCGRLVILHFAHITPNKPVEKAIARGLLRLESYDWDAIRRVS